MLVFQLKDANFNGIHWVKKWQLSLCSYFSLFIVADFLHLKVADFFHLKEDREEGEASINHFRGEVEGNCDHLNICGKGKVVSEFSSWSQK